MGILINNNYNLFENSFEYKKNLNYFQEKHSFLVLLLNSEKNLRIKMNFNSKNICIKIKK